MMLRSLVAVFCMFPALVLAQDPGLPGKPQLPSEQPKPPADVPLDQLEYFLGPNPEYLGPTEEELAEQRARDERTAVTAVAEYLTRLFMEDSQISADASLNWQSDGEVGETGGGVRLQFKSAALEAEVNHAYFDASQSGVTVRFSDLVGKRFSIRASVDRSWLRLNSGTVMRRFDNHALGYALGDATELEFEVFLRKDEAVGSYRDSFRAILKHQVGHTVYRIGLDRSYNGAPNENGELNAVAGVDLPPLVLRNTRHYAKLTTSVEAMFGQSDTLAPGIRNRRTMGLSGKLGLEVGANDQTWVFGGGTFRDHTFEGLGGDAGGQNRVTASGAWLYGSWSIGDNRRLYLDAKRSNLRTQLFGGDQQIERHQFEFGLERSMPKGRWRVGLNAGHHDAPGGSGWSTGVTVGFSLN